MSSLNDLVKTHLVVIEPDGSPGVRIALNAGNLAGPSGFSMRVTELQHTFLVRFEPHSLARPLVGALVREVCRDSDEFSSMRKRVNESSMNLVFRINGKDFVESIGLVGEGVLGIPAHGQSIEIEISGRLRSDSTVVEGIVSDSSRLAVEIITEFVLGALKPEVDSDPDIAFESVEEGIGQTVTVNRYERDPNIRRACIAHFGAVCNVCGFDFGVTYGSLGVNFIEVHHIVPLAQSGGAGVLVDPTRDVIPVCSNCHSMIHRGGATRDIQEVRDAYRAP